MKDVIRFLSDNPVQFFSTIGLDGKPKVRPFQFMLEDGGKLYFCTSNKKDVYAQLEKCPYAELSACSPGGVWIRLSGKVVYTKDPEIKKEIMDKSPLVKSIYGNPENPIFEAFYLEDAKAVIADFSGNPPMEYSL